MIINRNDISERDLFYWSLNIVTVFKYDRGNVNLSKLKSQFSKLYKSCQWYQVEIITFLKKLEPVFIFENYTLIMKLLLEYLKICFPKWEDTLDEEDILVLITRMYADRVNVDDSNNVGYPSV